MLRLKIHKIYEILKPIIWLMIGLIILFIIIKPIFWLIAVIYWLGVITLLFCLLWITFYVIYKDLIETDKILWLTLWLIIFLIFALIMIKPMLVIIKLIIYNIYKYKSL